MKKSKLKELIRSVPILGKLLVNAHSQMQKLSPAYIFNYHLKPVISQCCVDILRSSIHVKQLTISMDDCTVDTGAARFVWKPSDAYSLLGYPLRGNFEELETDVAIRIAKNCKCFVDVGGNFGWYTCHALGVMPAGSEIHVFEPVPLIREELKKNIALNSREDMKVYVDESCLSDIKGNVTIHVPKQHGAAFASMEIQAYKGGFDLVQAQTITLDEYCRSSSISSVDFLKIDVEGAELKVLQGARDILSRAKKPIILLESYPPLLEPFNCKLSDVLDYVRSFGYEGFMFHHGRLHVLNSENAGLGYDYLFVEAGSQAYFDAHELTKYQ